MKQTLPLTKIGFFNPGRLSDGEIEQLFTTRIPFFELLFNKIKEEKPGSIPQHYLVIGQRGMGKTSLLMRIAAELRKDPYRNTFIPLTFPEEQYNVDRLSKFWLNCMDALADALDKEGKKELLPELDAEIAQLSKNRNSTAKEVLTAFQQWTAKIKRRPVLLVDNLNLIFNTINKDQQHELRASLMNPGAPILVGASVISIDETLDYAAPFYDAFQISYLNKLSFEESMDVLMSLGKLTGNDSFETILRTHKGRVHALYMLTGGTPRTLAILFPLIQQGFSTEVQTDLDAILDTITPLYKARFEELAPQLQVIMDAVALHWDPATLEQIRDTTQLDNQQLSPQLKRLVDVGWLTKIKLETEKGKGNAYEVSERFFNIWYLMRRSSRRQKRELYCLTKFLEVFYGDDITEIARIRVGRRHTNENQVAFDLALADAVKDSELGEKLRHKSYNSLVEMMRNDHNLLDRFTLPEKFKNEKANELYDTIFDLLAKKEYKKAKNELELMLRINEKDKYGWTLLAYLNKHYLNSYTESEQAYLNLLNLDKKDASLWNSLGNLYQNHLGKYAESEQAYMKAISLDDKIAHPWNGLGNLYQDYLDRYAESEQAYLKALSLDDKIAHPWNGLGNLYQDHLGRYAEAEQAYLKAISLDENDASPWNSLGDLYQDRLGKYLEAEQAYLNAINLDEKDADSWFGLGTLYRDYLGKFIDAEQAFLNAINQEEKDADSWICLGDLYLYHLDRYADAEQAFLKAISLDEKDPDPWNGLGNLYLDYFKQYEKAESAYHEAIKLGAKDPYPVNNLVFLLRDKKGKIEEAEKIFETIELTDELKDSYWLHKTLFSIYDNNIGLAEKYLSDAIQCVEHERLPSNTREDWYRSLAVMVRLGFSNSVLKVFKAHQWDIIMRPLYVAIEAMSAKNSELFLNSVAAEVREPAKTIMEWMKNYNKD